MSRTFHHGERRIRVRGVRRQPTDLRRLARALIELEYEQARAEAEAESEYKRRQRSKPKSNKRRPSKDDSATGGERKEAA